MTLIRTQFCTPVRKGDPVPKIPALRLASKGVPRVPWVPQEHLHLPSFSLFGCSSLLLPRPLCSSPVKCTSRSQSLCHMLQCLVSQPFTHRMLPPPPSLPSPALPRATLLIICSSHPHTFWTRRKNLGEAAAAWYSFRNVNSRRQLSYIMP